MGEGRLAAHPVPRSQPLRFLEVPLLHSSSRSGRRSRPPCGPSACRAFPRASRPRQVLEHAVPLLRGLEVEQHDHLILEPGLAGGQGLLGVDQPRQRLAEQLHLLAVGQFLFPLAIDLARGELRELLCGQRRAAALGVGRLDPPATRRPPLRRNRRGGRPGDLALAAGLDPEDRRSGRCRSEDRSRSPAFGVREDQAASGRCPAASVPPCSSRRSGRAASSCRCPRRPAAGGGRSAATSARGPARMPCRGCHALSSRTR